MSCLFSVHQGGQVCSHTSPVLGTARAAHGRGFALDPRPPVPPHALSPCCNTSTAPLLLPGGQCWGWKAQVCDQPFPRLHKVLTNRGSCFRPPGKSAWFDTDSRFPCPPQTPAAPKHAWLSLQPHPAALQGPEQPELPGWGFCTRIPRKGPEGLRRGGMEALGWSPCLL